MRMPGILVPLVGENRECVDAGKALAAYRVDFYGRGKFAQNNLREFPLFNLTQT